jgi:hypothetical protein
MYEFHGLFRIAESPEESDAGGSELGIAGLQTRIADIGWTTAEAELKVYNGNYFVMVDGSVNRRRDEAAELGEILRYIATRFPGSWGLLYERSADMEEPSGKNAFRVRVTARGEIHTRLNPFLSPTRPVIEE